MKIIKTLLKAKGDVEASESFKLGQKGIDVASTATTVAATWLFWVKCLAISFGVFALALIAVLIRSFF